MKQPVLSALLFFWIALSADAQPYNMGLSMDDEAYEKAPHASENIQAEDGRRYIPDKLDLSTYCPEIRHQGDIASCVGWSVGYGAMTIERALRNNWKGKRAISENANSALFVYNQISRGDCNKGISLIRALDLLQDKGNCLAREFDYDINDCSKSIPNNLLQRAENYRINDYIRLFSLDATEEEKIKVVKLVLAQKKPVPVGMKVLQNFYNIKEGDQTWWPKFGNTTYAGGHAMVVVGYDDNKFRHPTREIPKNERGAFKLMNSWGKNWGENGYIWVRYSDFAAFCRYAFAILLEEGVPIKLDANLVKDTGAPREANQVAADPGRELLQLSGSFGFRQYTGWDQGPIFKETSVELIDKVYQLKGDWKVGDQFQLYTKNEFDNGYIYVLSVDQSRDAHVHFPRSEEYNPEFAGQHESPLIMTGGSVLTIPTEDSVLKLAQAGREHMVVLFSTKKIKAEYVDLLCRELAHNKENLNEHLHNMLSKFMVPYSDINYHPQQMGFDVSTRSEGKIVPVVLTLEVSE